MLGCPLDGAKIALRTVHTYSRYEKSEAVERPISAQRFPATAANEMQA